MPKTIADPEAFREHWIFTKAASLYYCNVNPMEWAQDFQTRCDLHWHPTYLSQQMDRFTQGFESHFARLDFHSQLVQILLIIAHYGDEAEKAWGLAYSYTKDKQ